MWHHTCGITHVIVTLTKQITSSPCSRRALRHLERQPGERDHHGDQSLRVRRRRLHQRPQEQRSVPEHAAVVRGRGRRALGHRRHLLPVPAQRERRGGRGQAQPGVHAGRGPEGGRAEDHEPEAGDQQAAGLGGGEWRFRYSFSLWVLQSPVGKGWGVEPETYVDAWTDRSRRHRRSWIVLLLNDNKKCTFDMTTILRILK